MTEIIRDIRLAPGETPDILPGRAAKKAGIRSSDIKTWRIIRRSLDARKKNDIHYTCSVEISTDSDAFGPDWITGIGAGGSAVPRRYSARQEPHPERRWTDENFSGHGTGDIDIGAEGTGVGTLDCSAVLSGDSAARRPVIAGFGPAGMFAGLTLARAGLRPVILERGQKVEERSEAVALFRKTGILNPESNAQFGEGGAGTFSDGKLNTGTHDSRIGFVLTEFYRHGAPESVLYDAKPHIGTDILVNVVRSIREEILSLGGEIFFDHRLEEIIMDDSDDGPHLAGVRVAAGGQVRDVSSDGQTRSSFGIPVSTGFVQTDSCSDAGNCFEKSSFILPCDSLILAVGHSARDTFEMLHELGIPMSRKAFSMGARIEHLQSDIDAAQYGDISVRSADCRSGGVQLRQKRHAYCRAGGSPSKLPAADYSLSVHLPDGTSAYTFCMCPGGYVFAAASEEGGICTNGMSYSGRSGVNANSALLVTLQPEDFPGEGVLAGMYWQREIERKAFSYSATLCAAGGGAGTAVLEGTGARTAEAAGIFSADGGSDAGSMETAAAVVLPGAYYAPCQLVGDFLSNRPSTGPGKVLPAYLPGVVWGDLRHVLPEKVTSVMAAALPELGKKLRGFAAPDAVLTGPETRSSSPVRILRDGDCMSAVRGLFPCGEGAGYAGGITSAAVDGIRCAEALMRFGNE